ncbi:MAG: FtsX-like permease family protein [Candidatus Thorarchaeota archaeon]|jgi:ABC-type antimicrobial peptide transport system permease subunit
MNRHQEVEAAMFKYALKRIVRSYRLFIALTIGVLLATTFFASTNVAADILSREALDASVEGMLYDFNVDSTGSNWTVSELENLESDLSTIDGITGSAHSSLFTFEFNGTGVNMTLAAIESSSDLGSNIQVLTGSPTLGENETYVVRGSANESLFELGQEIEVSIGVSRILMPPYIIRRNLTVVGYVDLPERNRDAMGNPLGGIFALLQGLGGGARGFTVEASYNIMIADWDLFMESIIDEAALVESHSGLNVRNRIHLKIDRAAILDPYDVAASTTRIGNIEAVVSSHSAAYDVTITSTLTGALFVYQITQFATSILFLTLSLPIFLLAYFTGTMVSDVGYNFRRREIGLLLTKGYQRHTIKRMFLVEGALIGAIAGAVSIFLGTFAAYLFLGVSNLNIFEGIVSNYISVILAIILGMFLGLISVWRPAGRASKLEILDALKQYIYVEETSEYKRLLPTVALLLGTYKLIVWTLGIDMNGLLGSISLGNFFISILIVAWLAVDSILGTLGPLLFLYGATKVFIRGSHKFQETVMTLGRRFFGAFGTLATRNVKRHPARTSTLVFIIALIVSYGIFATGSLFSQYDYTERTAQFDVGADVRLELEFGANVTELLLETAQYSGVDDVTPEYHLNLRSGTNTIDARGIRPEEWTNVAFWESSWFLGDFSQMIDSLGDDGIILSQDVAKNLELAVGDTLIVEGPFSSGTYPLTIVGLIGYLSPVEQLAGGFEFSISGDYTSFVSEDFLNSSNLLLTSTANILIDTSPDTNGTELQRQFIDELEGVYSSFSVTTELVDYESSPVRSGTTKIQWLAISFAVILAMVGTALVVILTLQEKDTEIVLLSVRGFSKWQLFKTLLAEVMVTVLFALLLGAGVGYIENLGQVSQLNGSATALVRYQIVLGGAAASTILILLGVVLLAAIIPVWWSSRRPETKIGILRS